MAPEPVYPLYASTYQVHRLSPLYRFAPSAFPRHAHSLQNLLRGEVLRGVRVGLGDSISDDTLARIGALQSVTWKHLLPESDWEAEQARRRQVEAGELDEGEEDTITTTGEDEGLGNVVEIVYEKARYMAILLRHEGNEGEGDEDELGAGFSSFPLLLTRMPGALRETFLHFLSATFDTRPSPLKFPPAFLTKSLETYLRDVSSESENDAAKATRIVRDLVKDLVITRTFSLPGDAAGTLKSLDVTIKRDDLWPFLVRGKRLAGLDGSMNGEANPFTMALSHHLEEQLALKLDHKSMGISRIACGAFVLGAEGKVKITQPMQMKEGDEDIGHFQEKATNALLDGIMQFAKTRVLR